MGNKKTDTTKATKKLGVKRDTLKKLASIDKKDLAQVAGGLRGGGLSRDNC